MISTTLQLKNRTFAAVRWRFRHPLSAELPNRREPCRSRDHHRRLDVRNHPAGHRGPLRSRNRQRLGHWTSRRRLGLFEPGRKRQRPTRSARTPGPSATTINSSSTPPVCRTSNSTSTRPRARYRSGPLPTGIQHGRHFVHQYRQPLHGSGQRQSARILGELGLAALRL